MASRGLRKAARDAIVVAALAVATVQTLRRWCGDRYVVPSDSMQPVLYGDEVHGDVVYVDKLARAETCRVHDLVVVAHPDGNGKQMVKRIAARGDDVPGGCWIQLLDGDVWIGEGKLDHQLVRQTKDPIDARSLQVPWAWWPGPAAAEGGLDLSAATAADGAWRVPPVVRIADEARSSCRSEARRERRRRSPALPAGCIGTARPVDASFIDALGERGGSGHDVLVRDCGMELEVDGACELLCSLDAAAHTLTFHVDLHRGSVALWCNGVDVAAAAWAPVAAGRHRIEFGRLDDRYYLVVDDRRDALMLEPRREAWPVDDPVPSVGPRTYLHVGVVGEQPLRVLGVRVFHDVFAWREKVVGLNGDPGQWPRFVPPGTWFLLGDNAFDSRDSRAFGARPMSSFLGKPRFVIGPWPRTRWLAP